MLSPRIRVRSRRQAMDFSLMLLSQHIPSSIDYSEELGWGLVVEAEDYERALEQIRQYRWENRRWPWRRPIRDQVLFDWGSVAWVLLIFVMYWLQGQQLNLQAVGLMDSAAVGRGEWWRLFTAMSLHGDLAHLAANAGFGLILLGLAMGMHGTGVGLLAAYLAGAIGNLSALLIDRHHLSLGASGMVMGALGLIAAGSLDSMRRNPGAWKPILAGFAAGLMLFLLLGSTPGTDLVAHAGGFLGGVLLGALLRLWPHAARSTALNSAAGGVFAGLVVATWWLASQRLEKVVSCGPGGAPFWQG